MHQTIEIVGKLITLIVTEFGKLILCLCFYYEIRKYEKLSYTTLAARILETLEKEKIWFTK